MALKELDQKIVRAHDHDIVEFWFSTDRVPEDKALRAHPGDECFEIICLNADMVHWPGARPFQRTVVQVDEGVTQRDSYIPCSRRLLIPHAPGVEHAAEKIERLRDVGGEDMDVIKTDAHRLSRKRSINPVLAAHRCM